MRTFLAAILLSLLLCLAASAGQPPGDMPQQQMAPPVVIIPQSAPDHGNSNTLIAVATITAVGAIIAAYTSRGQGE